MTTKSIDPGRLAAALREKYGPGLAGKRRCLKALGFDERRIDEMLRPPLGVDARGNRLPLARDEERSPPSSPGTEADKKWRVELEQILADADVPAHVLKKLYTLLDQKHPLSGDEEAELDVEAFSKVLRDKGIDEAVIEEALDMLPKSAIETGLPGGKFAEKRAAGMDARLDERFGLGRILVGDSGLTDRGRGIDRRPVPSAARLERINTKFGTERIGVHGAGSTSW